MAVMMMVLVVRASMITMLLVLQHILNFAAKKCTSQCANDSMICLLAQVVSANSTCYSAHEATFTLLRIARVCRISLIPVWVGRVARGWWAVAPRCLLALVLTLLVLIVLSLVVVVLVVLFAILIRVLWLLVALLSVLILIAII